MKLRYLIQYGVVLASLLLIASNTFAQPIRYPLHVGDVWQYDPGVVWHIDSDTVMPNGLHYAVVSHDYPYYPDNWISFERQEGNQVFRYFAEKDTEHLWFDFSIPVGEVVNTIPMDTDTAIIWSGGCQGDSLFGHYWPMCHFFIDYLPPKTDDDEGYSIADDIGVCYMFRGPWFWTSLVGAKVDDIIYGTFTDINSVDISTYSFRLYHNYPNPFNPSTQITYTVPRATEITLKIYDVLGREVTVLVNERKQAGEYHVTWNAEGVPSGVYFYRIVAGEFTQTKKLAVVK